MLQLVVPIDKTLKIPIDLKDFRKKETLEVPIVGLWEEYRLTELRAQNILYIYRIDKDHKKIVFSTPYILANEKYFDAYWKTRDSLNKITLELNLYDNKNRLFFQRISSKIIARNIFFSGRDANWKYMQLTGINYFDQTYKPVELEIGRDYLPEIKRIFNQFFSLKVSNSFKGDCPDIILINPIDIIYIESKKRSKVLHLAKPFLMANKLCFQLNWDTTISASDIEKKFNFIIQVNKNILVSLYHINNPENFLQEKRIELRLREMDVKNISISKSFSTKI